MALYLASYLEEQEAQPEAVLRRARHTNPAEVRDTLELDAIKPPLAGKDDSTRPLARRARGRQLLTILPRHPTRR
jgi:hypothetical protein